MTSFLEIQFPADISYGSSGGPEFSTDITELDSGKEQRNINWSTSRARYNASHGIKLDEQLTELISFFRIVKGRAFGFRFKDWLDYKAENQIIGTGDNSKTEFQLKKKYIFETYEVERDIKKPVDGTVKLYLNASLQSSGFSIDYTSGLITFDTAPANDVIVRADFEFDVPARFDSDKLDASIDDFETRSWGDIPIIEIKQ